MTVKTMKSFVDELRGESPALERMIQARQHREQLAVALHGLRTGANLTQKQVAERMGKDQAHVSRMESVGGPFPSADSINAYAHACGGSAGYVFVSPEKLHDRVVAVPLGEEDDGERFIEAMHTHRVKIAG